MKNSLFARKIQEIKNSQDYRTFTYLTKNSQKFPIFQHKGQDVINFCANDYLGMSINSSVISKVSCSVAEFGCGSGGTRNISGSSLSHLKLEKMVSEMHKCSSALVFNSAYMANLTALSVLGKVLPNICFLSDEKNHSSMINGIISSKGEKHIFKHNDMMHLEEVLASISKEKNVVIAFESVYSMNGNVAKIEEIVNLAKKYDAMTYIDEVHAVGLYGKNGFGMLEEIGLEGKVDIINGTFAKGYGIIGGYVAGSEDVIDCIRSLGSGFIFTTSMPSAFCEGVMESIKIVSENFELRAKFKENVTYLRKCLEENKIPFNKNASHITTIIIGITEKCKSIAQNLLKNYGYYIQPINYPTVSKGEDVLRITVTPFHSHLQIEGLANALKLELEKYEND